MAPGLCARIFDHGAQRGYWRPGDFIIDPFYGIGTTGLVGAFRGYNVIGVELEPNYVRMAGYTYACPGVSKGEWRRWQGRLWRIPSLCPRCRMEYDLRVEGAARVIPHTEPHEYIGNAERNRRKIEQLGGTPPIVLRGDSRNLAGLVREFIGAVTSPPYNPPANQDHSGRRGGQAMARPRDGGWSIYGHTPGQLEGLPPSDPDGAGDAVTGADGIITSPAYSNSQVDPGNVGNEIVKRWGGGKGLVSGERTGYGKTAGQLGNLKEGDYRAELDALEDAGAVIGGAITSPVYPGVVDQPGQVTTEGERRWREDAWRDPNTPASLMTRGYGDSDGQLSNMPIGDPEAQAGADVGAGAPADGVITSPPYMPTRSLPPFGSGRYTRAEDGQRQMAKEQGGLPGDDPAQLSNMPIGDPEAQAGADVGAGAPADGVITSPPFAQIEGSNPMRKHADPAGMAEKWAEDYRTGRGAGRYTRAEDGLRQMAKEQGGLPGDDPAQLGYMPVGDPDTALIDGAITSPVYASTITHPTPAATERDRGIEIRNRRNPDAPGALMTRGYGDSEGQLSNMPIGDPDTALDSEADAPAAAGAITSPPFAGVDHTVANRNYNPMVIQRKIDAAVEGYASKRFDYQNRRAETPASLQRKIDKERAGMYGGDPAQLGNMPLGDAGAALDAGTGSGVGLAGALTSPPFSPPGNQPIIGQGTGDGAQAARRMGQAAPDTSKLSFRAKMRAGRGRARGFEIADTGQMGAGNLASEDTPTYWASVAQIYRGIYQTLRPGGVAAIVVKDFIRNYEIVPLCNQTATLLARVGFVILERVHALLYVDTVKGVDMFSGEVVVKRTKRQSMFRRRYEKKNPHLAIDFEEVIFCRRPTSAKSAEGGQV
jgi:hypothetical protein